MSDSLEERLAPVHPGEVLRDFLDDYDITPYKLAKDVGLSRPVVNNLALGKGRVSQRSAALFGRYFGTTTAYWLNLQAHYDAQVAQRDGELQERLQAIVPLSEQRLGA